MFSIVEFGDGLAVVSKKWIYVSEGQTKCSWPPSKDSKNLMKKTINHETPTEEWEVYDVKKIFLSGCGELKADIFNVAL
jgi:hypothetical protein